MKKVIIPLEMTEIEAGNFHLFLYVRIGRKKVRLLLDTGASKTAFDLTRILRFIDKNKLKLQDIHSVGLGSSEVHTKISTLPSIRFGELTCKQPEVAVLDLSHVNEAYKLLGHPPIDGVLGSDLLHRLHAVIHYPKKQLTLKQ